MRTHISERALLLLIGGVQFVNVLDFMMVMPLGPDFARSLAIENAHLGYIGGAYTLAAGLAGLLGAALLDRFDRRKALLWALVGLVLGTASGGFAWDMPSLIAARILAGAFGGPAAAIALSIVSDVVPPERRGRALGVVMGAFAIASILGVPAGLELARLGGWPLPFFAVAGLGVVALIAAAWLLPPMIGHLRSGPHASLFPWIGFLRRPPMRLAILASASHMMAGFTVIPNLSAYVQFNGGYPRERLGLLYLIAGLVSLITMRVGGAAVDRRGATPVAWIGTWIFVAAVAALGFALGLVPVPVLFVGFMTGMTVRAIANGTIATRIPLPQERAGYLSVQSAAQHFACAIGAFLSARMLSDGENGRLEGMPQVSILAMALAFILPIALANAERSVRARERSEAEGMLEAESVAEAT